MDAPRSRNDVSYYDIDLMTVKQLRAFVRRAQKHWENGGRRCLGWSRELYPSRPINYVATSMRLLGMALLRLDPRSKISEYERLYIALPKYARFRRVFNIEAALSESTEKLLTQDENRNTITNTRRT
jgi:hypothetical protein